MITLHNPRLALLRAIIFDLIGSIVILSIISILVVMPGDFAAFTSPRFSILWAIFCLIAYFGWGWLFGVFTILRWEQLKQTILLQRILLTIVSSIITVAVVKWLVNPSELIWLLHRKTQFLWMLSFGLWSFWVKVAMHRGLFLPKALETFIVAEPNEFNDITKIWLEAEHTVPFRLKTLDELKFLANNTEDSIVVIYSRKIELLYDFRKLVSDFQYSNPCKYRFISILEFFEQRQERLPPSFLATNLITYGSTRWASSLSTQVQLKRLADVILSSLLLVLCLPIIFISSILIWIEDRGPIFFIQKRTGFLGRPFNIRKLRTMSVQPKGLPPTWTQITDHRITRVGSILRKTRIDELPQLINVLTGEMSLIGPRPERPEFEDQLESHIVHYRKRYWMRPGLSGWAQVSSPYASSLKDSSVKLSYDLYYLRNFNTMLDFIVLMRTIKTVLKAAGR